MDTITNFCAVLENIYGKFTSSFIIMANNKKVPNTLSIKQPKSNSNQCQVHKMREPHIFWEDFYQCIL